MVMMGFSWGGVKEEVVRRSKQGITRSRGEDSERLGLVVAGQNIVQLSKRERNRGAALTTGCRYVQIRHSMTKGEHTATIA